MIFQKKIDRAMDWLHDKKQTSKFGSHVDAEEEEQIELEKGDLLPIILSASHIMSIESASLTL